jgi:hypothetical protein
MIPCACAQSGSGEQHQAGKGEKRPESKREYPDRVPDGAVEERDQESDEHPQSDDSQQPGRARRVMQVLKPEEIHCGGALVRLARGAETDDVNDERRECEQRHRDW